MSVKLKKITKPKLKQKWVAALRSGNYPKTTGVLKDDDGFCCLGVLCEISPAIARRAANRTSDLGEKALCYLGIDEETQQRLIEINDDGTPFRQTFKGIASFIEKHL